MTYQPGLFDSWIEDLGWSMADGDCPGHWRKKPKGERCLWTCSWSTSRGLITPDSLLPAEVMSDKMLIAQLQDFSDRGHIKCSQALVAALQKRPDWKQLAIKACGSVRGFVPQYLAHWDMPPAERLIVKNKFRPGWGPPAPAPEPQPEYIDPKVYPENPRPKKPSHPAAWRARDQVTAMQMSQYQEKMEAYEKQLKEYEKKEKVKK